MQKLLTLFFVLGLFTALSAQIHRGGECVNPDSLTEITVTGTVIIDDNYQHPIYYLDTDNDGMEDYHLNFGPFWYEPDSSEATRPLDGEQITVTGGSCDSLRAVSTIIVYEINGEFWRNPYYAYWNNFDGRGSGRHFGERHNDWRGHTFGWRHDSLRVITLTGTALVDTTFYMNHYYLDVDNDTIPDYFLNFGPLWYQPSSGAVRPENGELVIIEGGLIEGRTYDIVVVYRINNLEWRDSSNFGTNIGGGWITAEMNQNRNFHNPYDENDYFGVQPGWHQGNGHHGGMMPDSLYCQMLELYPNNIPNAQNQNAFMGFEFGAYGSNGMNYMHAEGFSRHMGFSNNSQFQFHYNDIQIEGNEVDESTLTVKYWDEESSDWIAVEGASINTETNTITYSSSDIPQYVIVTADNKITSLEPVEDEKLSQSFSLNQNYPNPFNPATTIEFTIAEVNPVELTIYDVLGRKIQTLVSKKMEAGIYNYRFDASDLASGIYFYQLKVGNLSSVKKMNLMK